MLRRGDVRTMRDIYAKMTELLEKDETFALATIVNHQGSVPRHLAKMIIRKDGSTYGTIGGGCVESDVAGIAQQYLEQGRKGAEVKVFNLVEEEFGGVGMNCGGSIDVSIEILEPSPRLLVCGSGHMAAAIAKVGKMVGFEIVVIDPMAKSEKLKDAGLVIPDFVETGLSRVNVTANTYIVIVTRHKDDLPALRSSMKTNAGYIGLIGSKRRVVQVFQLLAKEGFSEKELNRVNAPIGLEIGAETPEEIAISIIAEIVQHRRIGLDKPALAKRIDMSKLKLGQTEPKAPEARSD